MVITISAKHMALSDKVADYIRQKMSKLPRYFNRIQELVVVVEKLRRGYHVEIRSDVEHHEDFVSTSDHENLFMCVDLAVNRSARQLCDWKEKIRQHRR
ncbi:MAG: ribosome-associated translation inhibitor RaiA [Planctomycetota bacterium]|nr:ribosome-associated translation inhibitor RaiA [Planctomycetota bacterium]